MVCNGRIRFHSELVRCSHSHTVIGELQRFRSKLWYSRVQNWILNKNRGETKYKTTQTIKTLLQLPSPKDMSFSFSQQHRKHFFSLKLVKKTPKSSTAVSISTIILFIGGRKHTVANRVLLNKWIYKGACHVN